MKQCTFHYHHLENSAIKIGTYRSTVHNRREDLESINWIVNWQSSRDETLKQSCFLCKACAVWFLENTYLKCLRSLQNVVPGQQAQCKREFFPSGRFNNRDSSTLFKRRADPKLRLNMRIKVVVGFLSDESGYEFSKKWHFNFESPRVID